MTPKQERFCEEYMIDLNATQAAIRAGYPAKTANKQGPRLLVNVGISKRIAELKATRSEKTGITSEMVLRELARIAFAKMRRVVVWGPDGVVLRESSEISEDDEAAISEVSQTITKDGGRIAVRMWNKVDALKALGEHLGTFDKGASADGSEKRYRVNWI